MDLPPPPAYLVPLTEDDVLEHPVEWEKSPWVAAFAGTTYQRWLEECVDYFGGSRITRAQMFALSRSVTNGQHSPIHLLIAVLAWGRVRRQAERSSPEVALEIVKASNGKIEDIFQRSQDPSVSTLQLYFLLALGGNCRIDGLGASFATKFLYFASYEIKRELRPLVWDSNVQRSLLHVQQLPSTLWWKLEWDPIGYELYLLLAHIWAEQLNLSGGPHAVEYGLFKEGIRLSQSKRRPRRGSALKALRSLLNDARNGQCSAGGKQLIP
jgi:hypothetical protein